MYFITTVYIKNKEIVRTKTVGYFSDFNIIKKILETNSYDLYEYGYYNFAVVENVPEGIYKYDMEPNWFKYDKKQEGFFECPAPRLKNNFGEYAQIFAFSIG